MKYKRLRGVKDVVTPENYLWEFIIGKAYTAISKYNYSLIITPTIEETSLFVRGIGEGSDIVSKEMYNFQDKKGRDIVLRPEGTASVVRAYIENSMAEKSDMFYIGPMFRYERPQKGRYREFFQIGVESFGDGTPYKDAEVIRLGSDIIKSLGISSQLRINSLSGNEEYMKTLKSYLESKKEDLCEDCIKKLERAPIRVLDCKKETCITAVKDAPLITDNLTSESKGHYEKVKELLNVAGVAFVEDPKMVRGLDYYTGVVFEFVTDKLGPQQNTILAGGRYDNLVSELGGKDVPATGFALGIERMAEVVKAENKTSFGGALQVYVIADKELTQEGFKILNELRDCGINAAMSFEGKSFKAQFKQADGKNALYAVIIGEEEMEKGVVTLKDMKTGEQKEVTVKDLPGSIKG